MLSIILTPLFGGLAYQSSCIERTPNFLVFGLTRSWLESTIYSTRGTPKSNKRPLSDSHNDLPATQMQEGRQMRHRNSVADLQEGDQKSTKPSIQRQNVTDKVIDALTSTDVLDKIMPVLTKQISETIVSTIESSIQSCVDSNIKPVIDTIKRQQITINEQHLAPSLANPVLILSAQVW
jgi:hypothetical protein